MMRNLRLGELSTPLQARLRGADLNITGVTTDSRRVAPGDLFVALQGERFDGHDFLQAVAEAGAVAAVVSRDVDSPLALLQVADTQRALGQLGAFNRSLCSAPLIAITGSAGKTTAKNLIAAVLSRRGPVLATQGNLNNEIGVPLTLLQLAPEHVFAVIEMGACRQGDVAWLCELARPNIAVPAHLEGFGSLEGVASAKGEIYAGLEGTGIAIVNADQPWAARWRTRAAGATVLDYGLEQAAAISAHSIQSRGAQGVTFVASTPAGEAPVRLQLPGRHNVSNALAAVAVGLACDLSLVDITAGLASVAPVQGRGARVAGLGGSVLIDDSYNANPGSVRAAIDVLAACPGRRTLVLGAMLELGAGSEQLHHEVWAYARERGIDRMIAVGPALLGAVEQLGGEWFADCEAASAALRADLGQDDTVLIKGSRGVAMERLLANLRETGN